jgi:hypothetical protein
MTKQGRLTANNHVPLDAAAVKAIYESLYQGLLSQETMILPGTGNFRSRFPAFVLKCFDFSACSRYMPGTVRES